MPEMSLSILIPTSGRPKLARALATLALQVKPGDEILVDVNADSPWGHRSRNRLMARAHKSTLLFLDDDDWYEHGALDVVRAAVKDDPYRVHMFRMHYGNELLWRTKELKVGNVSTQMFAVPNLWNIHVAARPDMARFMQWGNAYEGDFLFIESVCRQLGEPIWHEEVIVTYGRDL